MSAEPVLESRTRHGNGSPLGNSKTRELLYTAGAIGIGAVGGYYAVDYIVKSQMIERFLESIGVKINSGTVLAGAPEPDDKTAAFANVNFASAVDTGKRPAEIFDRTTRVNSFAARKFNRKYNPYVVEGGIDITQFQSEIPQLYEINQIVTDDDVYDSF